MAQFWWNKAGESWSNLIPQFSYLVEWPQDIPERQHNVFAKQALRETLERYHRDRNAFPRKFKRGNRQLYGFQPRQEAYVKYKQKRWRQGGMDMVKRGRTRAWMNMAYKLRLGGTAVAKTLSATLVTTFPFKGGSGRFRKPQSRQAITIERMIQELQRFADDEPRLMAMWFYEAYMRQATEYRRTRKRIRIRGKK